MGDIKYGFGQLRFITDDGHGWLEVPTVDVTGSGYQPSPYSYESFTYGLEAFTYLEEDCDVAGFLQALGIAPDLVALAFDYISYHDHTDSPAFVRKLPHCSGLGFASPFAR